MSVKTMVFLLPLLAWTLLGCGGERIEPAALEPEFQAELGRWFEENGQSPPDYVVGLFDRHDVVFLGEMHRIKHDLDLVRTLLAPLHAKGIRTLATEFARREDQALVDSIVTADHWQEELARRLTFNGLVTWGYQEYVDVFRAAWEINRELPADAPRFRVLAMGDSPDWSHVKKREDRDNPEVMRKVWRGGGEKQWAPVILEAVEAGEKVLAHTGIHHAFTEYRQPIVRDGEFRRFGDVRAGNHVFEAIGKRVVTVFLHSPWNGPAGYDDERVHPADGVLDAYMLGRDGGPEAVGFDLAESPFGRRPVHESVYKHGYEDFTPAHFADGWIYTRPFAEYEGVTVIPKWIDDGNLELARGKTSNPRFREASAWRFNLATSRSADIPYRLRHLR